MLGCHRAGQHDGRCRQADVGSFMTWGIPWLLVVTIGSRCLKSGNEEKCRIFKGWVKIMVLFLAVSESKFAKF